MFPEGVREVAVDFFIVFAEHFMLGSVRILSQDEDDACFARRREAVIF